MSKKIFIGPTYSQIPDVSRFDAIQIQAGFYELHIPKPFPSNLTSIVLHASFGVQATASRSSFHEQLDLKNLKMLASQNLKNLYYVAHIPAQISMAYLQIIKNVSAFAKRIAKATEYVQTKPILLLETPASSNKNRFASNPDALFRLAKDVMFELELDWPIQIGICLDTCHLFASGTLFEKFEESSTRFKDNVSVHVVHFNDSAVPFGSSQDVHASLGKGLLFGGQVGQTRFEKVLDWIKNYSDQIGDLSVITETPDSEEDATTLLKIFEQPISPKVFKTIAMSNKDQVIRNEIINAFNILSKTSTNHHRTQTFNRVSKLFSNMTDHQLSNVLDDPNSLELIPGIGPNTVQRIKTIIRDGFLQEVEDEKTHINTILKLSKIPGITLTFAKQLASKGITIDNILDDEMARKILNKHPSMISHLETITQKMSLREAQKIVEFIKHRLLNSHIVTRVKVAGSVRRKLPFIGDVDILVTHNQWTHTTMEQTKNILSILDDIIVTVLSAGSRKLMLIVEGDDFLARRVDILLALPKEWPSSLLYFTGSKDFNIAMRKSAISQGLKLNEKGLFEISTNHQIDVTSEKNIFDILGWPHIPPNKR